MSHLVGVKRKRNSYARPQAEERSMSFHRTAPMHMEIDAQEPAGPSPLVSFFQSEQYGPVYQRLMSLLSTRDLLSLCQTNREIHYHIKTHEWNLNTKLRRFVADPCAFRTVLGQCDGLISGSFALQFFERVVWNESDLDIMLRDGPEVELMERYLVQKEGYRETKQQKWIEYFTRDVVEVRTFHNRFGRKIQLILNKVIPVQAIIRSYYTTAVVNFISWNKAFSLFPRTTFLEHETAPLQSMTSYYASMHAKYSKRGWRLKVFEPDEQSDLPIPGGDESDFSFTSRYNRRVGDRLTWTLPLDTTSVMRPTTPDFVLECSCFRIAPPEVGPPLGSRLVAIRTSTYVITADRFVSPCLKYDYCFGSLLQWENIGSALDRSVLIQFDKLTENDRAELAQRYGSLEQCSPYTMKVKTPEGWDFWDDKIPGMLDKFCIINKPTRVGP